ncbi:MAG: DNA translocase FtsK [Spirochaetaceae bacterium]|nr:DNA translocase FtsK [Spirochaetaceae bacterium]
MSDKTHQGISLFFSILSVYGFFSIIYGWFGGELSLFLPGIFLFKSFNAAALIIPIFLAFLAKIILAEEFNKAAFLKLNLFIIPFLSASLVLKLLLVGSESPAEKYFITAFGKAPSIMLLTALTLVAIILIIRISELLYPQQGESLFSFGEFFSDFLPQKDRSEDDTLVDRDSQEMMISRQKPQLEPLLSSPIKDSPSPIVQPEMAIRVETPKVEDSDIHDLISNVLKGDSSSEENEKEMPEYSSAYSSQPSAYDDLSIKDVITNHDKEEFTPLDTREKAELKFSPYQDETDSVVDEDQREDKLDSLLSTLNQVLEEDRPKSISEKLSPDECWLEDQDRQFESAPNKATSRSKKVPYEVPVEGVLKVYTGADYSQVDDDTRKAGKILEETLSEFKIDARVTGISRGPVITMFELLPAPGVKLSRIVALQDNIALRLAASRVRIVAPIPGKHAVGIEIPNKKRSIVGFSQLVHSSEMTQGEMEIPIVLGKDINGGDQVIDLTRTPHLLIAGSTGSGKSVCVNSLICSILYHRSPSDVKMILVDPKIVELKLYNDIPHLLTPVITEPKRAFQAVQWSLYEMERRYTLLDSMGVRDIKTYNKRIKVRKMAKEKIPYLVVVIDEFADLMATSGKELEGIVARLAAMSRAVGIHLVLATQRPSTDVITGLIKANFPSRIAFMVAGMTDSRIIIDTSGAEKLLGRGDMLFTSSWDPFPTRVQGAFLSEEEVERVVNHVKTLGEPNYIDDEIFVEEEDSSDDFALSGDYGEDPLFDNALDVVVNSGKASASYLQRRLKIGYNRAARLVEDMEDRGIVGPANGSKARDILHIPDRARGAEEPSLSGSST